MWAMTRQGNRNQVVKSESDVKKMTTAMMLHGLGRQIDLQVLLAPLNSCSVNNNTYNVSQQRNHQIIFSSSSPCHSRG